MNLPIPRLAGVEPVALLWAWRSSTGHDILNGESGARILVVEDDLVSASLMQKILERQGLASDLANTGVEALQRHREGAYRLVLSDWMMPEMTGTDLCRELRKLGGTYTYFVLCSSKGERADRVQAFDAGVDDFLLKPVDRDELHARLTVARRILAMEDDLQKQYGELEVQKRALLVANERLQHLAITDGLTGLWNHRRFHEELVDRVSQHRESGKPLSLMLLDIDHFKRFNDSFGHQAGDDLLRHFASILKEQSRGTDFPARYGGEEFAMILSGAAAEQSVETAERFRHAIQREAWSGKAVTASFGVATLDDAIQSPRELIERADQAMYAAKTSGRNQVVHWNSVRASDRPDRRKAA